MARCLHAADERAQPPLALRQLIQRVLAGLQRLSPLLLAQQLLEPQVLRVLQPDRVVRGRDPGRPTRRRAAGWAAASATAFCATSAISPAPPAAAAVAAPPPPVGWATASVTAFRASPSTSRAASSYMRTPSAGGGSPWPPRTRQRSQQLVPAASLFRCMNDDKGRDCCTHCRAIRRSQVHVDGQRAGRRQEADHEHPPAGRSRKHRGQRRPAAQPGRPSAPARRT